MRLAVVGVLAAYFGTLGYAIAKSGLDKRVLEAANRAIDERQLRSAIIWGNELKASTAQLKLLTQEAASK